MNRTIGRYVVILLATGLFAMACSIEIALPSPATVEPSKPTGLVVSPATVAAVSPTVPPILQSASPTRAGPISQTNLPPAPTATGAVAVVPVPTRIGTVSQTKLPPAPTVVVVPVPVSTIQIDGVPYKSHQMPGDPFRFVCQEPCTTDPQLFFASYAGFRIAREKLIKATGIDTLPELQPVDIHVKKDQRCRMTGPGQLPFADYTPHANAFLCTFLFEIGVEPQRLVLMEIQHLLIHEYLHTFFFGRIAGTGAMHDIVTPVALNVLDFHPAYLDLCAHRPQTPYGDYGGSLIYELCTQNGFRMTHLAPSLIELDKLYQSGGGRVQAGFIHPSPTMSQYRDILNRVLGSDTTKAFVDACWPANLFAEDNTFSPGTPTTVPTPIPKCARPPSTIATPGK